VPKALLDSRLPSYLRSLPPVPLSPLTATGRGFRRAESRGNPDSSANIDLP